MSRRFWGLATGFFLSVISLAAQPEFTVSEVSANQGETVDINIVVDDYTDYISLQFSMRWDTDVASFQDIKEVTDMLPGFSAASSINVNAAEGFLTVSWFEQTVTPVSLPDGSNVFTLSFEVVGDPCDSTGINIGDDPLAIEIADASEMNVGATVNNGYISVPGSGCSSGGLRFIGSMETAESGQQVCVQFTSQGFTNIAAAQFTLNFDPAVLDYTGIENINWPGVSEGGNFGATGADNGEITFVWFDQNATGVDLADGTVLFEVCFDVIGSSGQMSNITFGDDPRPIEFSDSEGNLLDFSFTQGKVNVEGGMIEGFALIGEGGLSGAPGSTVCMPVTVNDFNDIVSMQFSINWDSSVLQYNGTQNFNLPDFSGSNVAGPEAPLNDPGQATVLWFDQSVQGVSVPNETIIFEICFTVVGDCDESTSVDFTGDPLAVEVSDINEIVQVSTISGNVSVVCGGCEPSVVSVVDPSCPGDSDGSIDIQVTGCPTPVTFMWSNGETTEDVGGLPAGEYAVTITTGDNSTVVLDMIVVEDPEEISVNATITDAEVGGDGAIEIMPMGGTEPYSFMWSNGETTQNISGLDAGEYTVTITDANGCEFVGGPYMVNQDGAIIADITNVACFGESTGAISITSANCGPDPQTFAWSNGDSGENIEGLEAATYTVTITANDGSTCTESFEVTGPDSAIEVTADTTNETSAGNDGSIILTVSGGEGPYSYIWSNGETTKDIDGLSAGTYTVTITDSRGCEVVESILIRGQELFIEFVISDQNGFNVSCFGECDAQIVASVVNAVGNIDYMWSTGETTAILDGVCAGALGLTVTDDLGQTAEAIVDITEPSALIVELDVTCVSEPGASDGGAVAITSGGIPPYEYSWSTGDMTSSISDQRSGPLVLVVTDDNSCENIQQSEICIEGVDCYEAITVITPNGDGRNDEFIIQCIFENDNRLRIFNRYGGLEFEMDNYDNSWNGVDNSGNELSDGGYHWVLEVFLDNGELRVFKGTISIVKSLD